jgi:molybdopterin converting factor small subunit
MAKLLYFAQFAEVFDTVAEDITLPAEAHDVRGLLAWLRTRGKPWDSLLLDDAVRVAIDRQIASLDTPVAETNEIALIPLR